MSAEPATDTSGVKGRQRFSARGRTWMIVLRPPWGQPVDRAFVRWTGFSPMTLQYALAGGMPLRRAWRGARQVLLLTTIGHRTGRLRTTVLPYFRYQDALVVCGSNGGGPRDPHWADNVRAEHRAWVRVGGRLVPASAEVAAGDERSRVFAAVAAQHDGLERYQRQASRFGRDVPLVVLRLTNPA
ncbi:MAG TPA: nitroreductase/quinone reductase family protein [Acidimicrobiia bacterium]|nr:nitroreductase/quinone reductase family protein [Acidimicrobiia bacterium]